MANAEHLKILQQGVEVWNEMWALNPQIRPDLIKADLSGMNLEGVILNNAQLIQADLSGANLRDAKINDATLIHAKLENADFTGAQLCRTNFSYAKIELLGANFNNAMLFQSNFVKASLRNSNFNKADLVAALLVEADFEGGSFIDADFNKAELNKANFRNANLSRARMRGADLGEADFTEAILNGVDFTKARLNKVNFASIQAIGSDLSLASLVGTDFTKANLERTRIYGISAWDIKKDGLIQKDLIVTPEGEPEITVDDLEVAQFIYLMLNNQNIRNVIETISSKAVLILGRFTEERKKVLDALKDELRLRNYLPIVFDFDKPSHRDIDETVNLLARMSRFVVADVTNAKSIPQELKGFVGENPSIPVVPLILKGQSEYAMFDHFRNYHWVLPLHEYASSDELLANIVSAIIAPAEQKVEELRLKK